MYQSTNTTDRIRREKEKNAYEELKKVIDWLEHKKKENLKAKYFYNLRLVKFQNNLKFEAFL